MAIERKCGRRVTLGLNILQCILAIAGLAITIYLWQIKFFDDWTCLVYMSFVCGTSFISGLLGVTADITQNQIISMISVNFLNSYGNIIIYTPALVYFTSVKNQQEPTKLHLLIPCVLMLVAWEVPIINRAMKSMKACNSSGNVDQETNIRSTTTGTQNKAESYLDSVSKQHPRGCTLGMGIAQSILASAALSYTVYLWEIEYFVDWRYFVFVGVVCGTSIISGSLAVAAGITRYEVLIIISAIVNLCHHFVVCLIYAGVLVFFYVNQPQRAAIMISIILISTMIVTQYRLVMTSDGITPRTVKKQTKKRKRTTKYHLVAGIDNPGHLENSGVYIVSTGKPDNPDTASTPLPDQCGKVNEEKPNQPQGRAQDMAPVHSCQTWTAPPVYPGHVSVAPANYEQEHITVV